MTGVWRLANGLEATVTAKSIHEGKTRYYGIVRVDGTGVPTYWDELGNNENPNLNLMERRRSLEQKWK